MFGIGFLDDLVSEVLWTILVFIGLDVRGIPIILRRVISEWPPMYQEGLRNIKVRGLVAHNILKMQ